ncbi:regulatory protein RecX [Microbacterium indicum]|uniref:regulatory protein RecX n=1 Tax=Microbacterium indicum TaxID=358100 RepID=UPI00041C5142|nr:regulatory protein RecX [Microbacterium indicum]
MSDGTDGGEHLAPVVPLFGGPVPTHPAPARDEWHTTWSDDARRSDVLAPVAEPVGAAIADDEEIPGDAEVAERAEARLAKALATRDLSAHEARERLRRDEVAPHLVDDIVDRLERVGAIDDDRLAEQLVHSAVTRRNQGRRAIAQALAARGVAREAIDRALDELPDDDRERAIEFARQKAPALARYDDETALRRLVGQLSRRGFGGSMAYGVARDAIAEAKRGSRGGGVRFR